MTLRPPRHRQRPRSPARNERGQTIILVAVMVLSFLMFFGFTLNTGLLINAKISVQSAADAAAYAGAATQARQLNAISYLNYDMRRQFKKFLFRNVVVGSLGSPEFPKNHDDTFNSPYDFPKFDFSKPKVNNKLPKVALKVPVVCIPVVTQTNDDKCVTLNIRDTAADVQTRLGSLASAGGSIIQTLLQQVNTLQGVQRQACGGQAAVNQLTVLLWLFRGNPDDSLVEQQINQMLAGTSSANPAAVNRLKDTLKGLVKGLGLYPRNILHLMRIETLEKFLNEAPKTVTREDVAAMERNVRIAESRERTILAFKSALSNLNTTVFNPDDVFMEELHPDSMLGLETVRANVDLFIQSLSAGKADLPSTICNSHVYNFPALDIPVGVKLKSPNRTVFYAVKVRVKVRPRGLLFMPSGEALELEAVAGAKPFGSRIGPIGLSGTDFVLNGGPTDLSSVKVNGEHICKPDQAVDHNCNVPNLEMLGGTNFFDSEFLQEIKTQIGNPSTTTGIIKAQYYAMAPNPMETGHYNIIPPPSEKEGQPSPNLASEFIPTYDGREKSVGTDFVPPAYRFYAPIYRNDESADIGTYIDKFLKGSLPNVLPNQYGLSGEQVRQQTKTALQDYINGHLEKGENSELHETLTFAAVELPMAWLKRPAKKPFWLTQASEVLSSWGPEGKKPRFGYSVRFVALRDLMSQGVSNPDSTLDSVSH